MPVARTVIAAARDAGSYELVFVDDADMTDSVNGHRVFTYEQLLRHPAESKAVSVAIADPFTRQRVAARCAADGLSFFPVVAPGTLMMDEVRIGEGAILSPLVTLTSNIRIGRFFHCNLYSYVEHDCVIGDFVTFAPAVRCNGNVHIEDHAYLGSGCIIKQGTPDSPVVIGRGAVIGMGAVVTRSVAAGMTVVGTPARPVQRS